MMGSGMEKNLGEWSQVTQQKRDRTKTLLEQLKCAPFTCLANLPLSVSQKACLVQYFV